MLSIKLNYILHFQVHNNQIKVYFKSLLRIKTPDEWKDNNRIHSKKSSSEIKIKKRIQI